MKALLVTCMLAAAPFVWAGNTAATPPQAGNTVSGEVLELKDVDSYTYLRLKTAQGDTWAAVPTAKVANVGMRKLSEPVLVKKALETLKGRARVKRTMWSRRAQEYEAKINSGDIVAIAEVVRDLYRSESQPEQSYSERQLYEAALDRLSREIAVVQHVTETEAVKEIEGQLAKSPRRGAKAEAEVEADGEADADADGDDAAVADEAA